MQHEIHKYKNNIWQRAARFEELNELINEEDRTKIALLDAAADGRSAVILNGVGSRYPRADSDGWRYYLHE